MVDRKPGRRLLALPVDLALVAVLAIGVVTLARAVWYPFWAAGASREELARSWGGPSAVGATLVHWLVAAVLLAGATILVVVLLRLRRRVLVQR